MKLPEPKHTKSGDYAIQLRLDGQSIYIHGRTQRECRDKARLYKSEYLAGVRSVKLDAKTLSQAINDYICRRQNTLSPSTIEGYRRIQKNRFKKEMALPLDSKIDWQTVCNAEALLCSPKTLQNSFRFIVSVLRENGLTVPRVTLPPLTGKPRAWLEPEQIKVLVSSVSGDAAFPVLLGLHSLRRSEILAVTWDDIDLKNGTIRVSGAVVMDENRHYVEKPTNKTMSSARTVPIMIPELKAALEAVPAEQHTGRIVKYSPHYVGRAVDLACRRAGVPEVGTHGLRHSFASLAYHLGLSELETMRLGGWSDAQTMRKIYTHLSEGDRLKAENKMKSFYSKD